VDGPPQGRATAPRQVEATLGGDIAQPAGLAMRLPVTVSAPLGALGTPATITVSPGVDPCVRTAGVSRVRHESFSGRVDVDCWCDKWILRARTNLVQWGMPSYSGALLKVAADVTAPKRPFCYIMSSLWSAFLFLRSLYDGQNL
jgi:hypothetical protein